MMAVLFLIFLIALLMIAWQKRQIAFSLILLNLFFCLLMLLHHATDVLKIRL